MNLLRARLNSSLDHMWPLDLSFPTSDLDPNSVLFLHITLSPNMMHDFQMLQSCCKWTRFKPVYVFNERRMLTGWLDLLLFCFCCCLLQSLSHALGGCHTCLRSFHFWPEHHDHHHADTGQDLKVHFVYSILAFETSDITKT